MVRSGCAEPLGRKRSAVTHLAVLQQQVERSTPGVMFEEQPPESTQDIWLQGPVPGAQQAGGIGGDTEGHLGLGSYKTSILFLLLLFLSLPPSGPRLGASLARGLFLGIGYSGYQLTVRGIGQCQRGDPGGLAWCLGVKLPVGSPEAVGHKPQGSWCLQQHGVAACPG